MTFNEGDKIKWRAKIGFSTGVFAHEDGPDRIFVKYSAFGKTARPLSIPREKIVEVNDVPVTEIT